MQAMNELPNNQVRFVNSTKDLLKELSEKEEQIENIKPIEVEDSEENYDIESSLSLDSEMEINGIEFPAPTTAFLMFLDLMKSPFILGGDPTLQDIYASLFVLKFREKAFKDCYGIFAARKYLDKYEKLIEKSPEYLDVVLKYREEYENKLQKFHSMAAAFGESLGVFKFEDIGKKIEQYIMACFGGFDMLPKENGHKKKDLTANG